MLGKGKRLEKVARCPATANGKSCDSAIFYDWGLEILDTRPAFSITGGEIERFKEFAAPGNRVKICAICQTPYVLEGGELIDLSAEIGPEDIDSIIRRGQAVMPHPVIKDP